MNNDWAFHRGDVADGAAPTLDDSHWTAATVPHIMQLEKKHCGGNIIYDGIGWYRRYFKLPQSYRHKRVAVAFEGVTKNCTVYEVNFQSDGSFWIDGVTTLPRHYNAQGKLIETVANAEGMAAHQGTSNVVFNYGSHKYVALIGTPGTVWPDAYMALLDVTAGVGSPVLKAKLPESFGTSNWGASSGHRGR